MKSSITAFVRNPYVFSLPGGELRASVSAREQQIASGEGKAGTIAGLSRTGISGHISVSYAALLRVFGGSVASSLPVRGDLTAKIQVPRVLAPVVGREQIELSAHKEGELPALFPRLVFFFVPSVVGKNGFGLSFSNQAPTGIQVENVNGSLWLQGQEIFKGEKRPEKDSNGSSVPKVLIEFDWKTLGSAALNAAANRRLLYRVQGSAMLVYGSGQRVPLEFDKEGAVSW